MNFYIIICLTIFIITFVSYLAYYYYKENKINYSNYQNCLTALSESDPKLKAYLEAKLNSNNTIKINGNFIKKSDYKNIMIIIITDKQLIKKLTEKSNLNEIHLQLDHKNLSAKYEDDYTNFELSTKLYYYKTKTILKENL